MSRTPGLLLLLSLGLSLAAAPAFAVKRLDVPNPLQSATNANAVALSWGNVAGETGYLIERRPFDAGSFAEIAKTTADLTSYTDILTTTVNYEYRVRAYKAGPQMVYSAYSNIVVSTVPCE
jgi:hypothetical protein